MGSSAAHPLWSLGNADWRAQNFIAPTDDAATGKERNGYSNMPDP